MTTPLPTAKRLEALHELRREIVRLRRCHELQDYVKTLADKADDADNFWGKPVPGWGDAGARLWILGLCPGPNSSSRTGIPFWGDAAGDWLYSMLKVFGKTSLQQGEDKKEASESEALPSDAPALQGVWMSHAVRLAAPRSRPDEAQLEAFDEFLRREWELLADIRVILAMGDGAFRAAWNLLSGGAENGSGTIPRFQHGEKFTLNADGREVHLLACRKISEHTIRGDNVSRDMLAKILRNAIRLGDQ